MSSDLHIHTTASDGQYAPEKILSMARQAGLRYIAITDHDNVDGLRNLYEAGMLPGHGMRVIPGIEFSAQNTEHEVHILGYDIDIYDKNLSDSLNDIVEARWTRFSKMVENLRGLGYGITEADVLKIAGMSKAISRPHIARALVEKGLFPSVSAAFDAVLAKGRPAYEEHYRMEAADIIKCIKDAGGIPVLAHPKLIGDDILVERLLQLGLEGIEAFYPRHNAADVERYKALAEKYGILISGGSDFHGPSIREPLELGIFTIEDKYAEKFYREEDI